MANTLASRYSPDIHPLHGGLAAGTVPLFLGATLSDLAYAQTYEVQWSTFASWLIAGGLVLLGVALVFAVVDLVRRHRGSRGIGRYTVALVICWLTGFIDALVHARDAWASMPEGLILSVIVTILAAVATWLGFAVRRTGDIR